MVVKTAMIFERDSRAGSDSCELLHVAAARATIGPSGGLMISRRSMEGMNEYAKHWPGALTELVEVTDGTVCYLDPIEVQPDENGFNVEVKPDSEEQLARRISKASLVLTSVDKSPVIGPLCRSAGVPEMYVAENTLRTKFQILDSMVKPPLRRWKQKAWLVADERRIRRAVRRAVGIQCNGTPTFESYSRINPRPLLFFDSRIQPDMLVSDGELEARTSELLAGGPLRLVFSGRLNAIKGVDHLPLVGAELRRLGVPFLMNICGGGELEGRLQSQIDALGLGEQVRLKGVMDFHEELLPFVSRYGDLFLCSHLQGDPSCTYLETMACGTPIVGYCNEAFRGIVEKSGVGWLTPMAKPRKLAEAIAKLHRNRSDLVVAARTSRAFAGERTFEQIFEKRVRHMIECAGLA